MVVDHESFKRYQGNLIMSKTLTPKQKMVNAFTAGRTLTTTQVWNLGYRNPSAAISNLRTREGLNIVGIQRDTKAGVVTSYSLVAKTKVRK